MQVADKVSGGRVRAAIVFADLTGFTALCDAHGAERAYGIVTGVLKLLDRIVRRHGGAVDKYLGDSLMAVFGHPRPHPEGSAAAIRASLEMLQAVQGYNREAALEIPLSLCVGINTGSMIAGEPGGPVVREFHVMGDAVNTAARIKSKAPAGNIFVGPETQSDTEALFDFDAVGELALKGKAVAVSVHRVTGIRPESAGLAEENAPGELLGREGEVERLRAHIGEDKGRIVVIVGPEGIGKSRLLATMAELADSAGRRVITSTASAVADDRPFHALAGLLRRPGAPESGDRSRVGVPAELCPEIAHLLGAGATLGAEPADPTTVGGEIAALLSRIADAAPLAVLFDEFHHADTASLAAFPALCGAARYAPVCFGLALRDDESCTHLLEALEQQHGQRLDVVELAPLDLPSARRLVAGPHTASELPSEALQLILKRSQGNPRRLIMGAYISGALRSESDRERAGGERTAETERRYSTVLFADLTGFTAMSERLEASEVYPIVSECLGMLDDIARQHGGTVDKHLGDCVLALFGIPRALEGAPRAAANAAIEMVQQVRQYSEDRGLEPPLDLHVGLNTGLGIAGEISGPLLREFAVMGDPVVIASELCDQAKRGQIFVGAETHRFTCDDFDFRPAEPLRIKGRREPVQNFELVSRVQRLHRARVSERQRVHSRLVGRDTELGILREALDDLERGRGGIVSLIAEAGCGKSRLVAEVAQAEASRGIGWREGRAISTGQQQSYHPFADMCRAWAAIDDEDDEASARAKLRGAVEDAVGEESREIFPFIAAIAGARLEGADRQRLERARGEFLEQLVRSSLLTLLQRSSATAPLVVVLDDLHWADQSSIQLLESMLRLVADHPILLLNVFRPGYPLTSGRILDLARKRHEPQHREIELQALDPSAARELIKNLFREGDIPQDKRQMIEDKTRGNPFYIEEVVRTLVDLGAVELRDGSFHATDRIASVEIPGTVQEAVMARIDRLGLERKGVLQAASVIGGSFHLEVLEEMVAAPEALAGILETLEADEFIVPSDRSAGIEFAFKHPLIQEITYDALLEAKREALHLEVARATERRLMDDVPGYYAMLAYHFSLGRDTEHSEEYLFKAGHEASRMAASSEALHFFREASHLYFELHGDGGDPVRKALLEKNLARALLNKGHLIEAVDHFDRATGFMGARVSRRPVAMFTGFAFDLARVLSGIYSPVPRRRRPATGAEKELFDTMFQRAMAQSTTAPTRFLVDSVALLRRLARIDPHTVPESAAMYSGVVGIFAYGGLSFDVSRRFLRTAHRLAGSGAVDEGYLYYRTLNLMHHMLEGDWSDEHEVDLQRIRDEVGEGRFWEASTCLNLLGVKRIYQGSFPEARQIIEELAKIADLYEHDLAGSLRHVLPAFLHTERREFSEALAAIEHYYDEHREPLFNLQALATRGKIEALMGEPERAEATLERAAALFSKAGRPPPWHASTYLSARFLADVEALERARQQGSENSSAAEKRARASGKAALAVVTKVAWRRPEVLRLAGRRAWLMGRRREAFAGWKRAHACCRSLGTRPELARTLQAVGSALTDGSRRGESFDGRDAAACTDAARTIFADLGLAWDLARIEARNAN